MVDIRCKDFADLVWSYVAENATRRGTTRCEALKQIVIEHMKFLAEAQREAYEAGKEIV